MATDDTASDDDAFGRRNVAGGFSKREAFGMTRRFSLRATMLLVTIAAGLLAVLRCVEMPVETSAFFLVLLISSAAAQAFMFGGRKPRRASLIAGAIMGMAFAIISIIIANQMGGRGAMHAREEWPEMIILGGIIGAVGGYATGGLVAGVFLLIDRYDQWRPRKASPAENIDPLADD